jgi:hypothetical protein
VSPPELRQLMVRRDQGEPHDKAALDWLKVQAVVFRRQAKTGDDIASRPSPLDNRDRPNLVATYERMTSLTPTYRSKSWARWSKAPPSPPSDSGRKGRVARRPAV